MNRRATAVRGPADGAVHSTGHRAPSGPGPFTSVRLAYCDRFGRPLTYAQWAEWLRDPANNNIRRRVHGDWTMLLACTGVVTGGGPFLVALAHQEPTRWYQPQKKPQETFAFYADEATATAEYGEMLRKMGVGVAS